MTISTAIQTVLEATAACLIWTVAKSSERPQTLAAIALLAFASGAQVALAKTVNMPEIPTAVLTSAYMDILVDKRLFRTKKSFSRDRRILFIITFICGTFIGAAAYQYVQAGLPLQLVAGCQLAVTLAFLVNAAAS